MPKKILVIEDEESIRNIIRVFLEDAGYTVFVAGDGLEGVNKFHEKSPDLVLLDLMLPRPCLKNKYCTNTEYRIL